MKYTPTALLLLLTLMVLAPCSSLAAGAPATVTSAFPTSAAIAATTLVIQQPGQEFMTWLTKQPGQAEPTNFCGGCISHHLLCCDNCRGGFYCADPQSEVCMSCG